MKKNVSSIENLVNDVVNSIIYDGRYCLLRFYSNQSIKDLEGLSFPDKIEESAIKHFQIFMFVLELFCLPNIFQVNISSKLRSLMINCFSNRLHLNEDELLKDINLYEKVFFKDIENRIDPFDSMGILSIICDKVGFRRTVDVGENKGFSPIPTSFLGSYVVALTGRWRKINEFYNVVA